MKWKMPEFFSKREQLQSPELTQFAQYLVDNEEVKGQVQGHVERLRNIQKQPDLTIVDRRDLGLMESALSDIVEDAGVTIPEGVTASVFVLEMQNRVDEGSSYVPTWMREGEDGADGQVEQEQMQIDSLDALRTLYLDNSTVRSLIDKVHTGSLSVSELQQKLDDAGYDTDDTFSELLEALGQEMINARAEAA